MKKLYITSAIAFIALGLSAQISNVPTAGNPEVLKTSDLNPTMDVYNNSNPVSTNSNVDYNSIRRSNSAVTVGITKYDLQSNASVARRVHLYPDGTVSIVWTNALVNTFTDRGTGYFHVTQPGGWFNATPLKKDRVENLRTGWPQMIVRANGNEVVFGHLAEDGGWARYENTGKGTAFTQTDAVVNDNGVHRPIWGRIANAGDTVYMISNYADSARINELRAPTINGVRAPMTYSRSVDGGRTWPISHIMLPGYDSSRYTSGGGDQYSIDANKNVVAIAITDLTEDLAFWKSTDYGATFTKTIVDSFKYAPYNAKKLMLDTPVTHDATSSILVDDNGNVHLAWGLSRVLDTDTSDESFSFFPGTAGIAYWNEISQNTQVIATGLDLDVNGNGQIDAEAGNTATLTGGALPANLSHVARTGNTSLMTMPSLGIDDQNRVFCSFSYINEDALDQAYFLNLRDAYIVMSPDGGATWNDPMNATTITNKEVAFPSIAKRVDNFVHFQFQIDDIPGTNLQNNSDASQNHDVVDNNICYLAVPVSQIVANGIDNATKVENIANSKVFVVGQNLPNPFSGTTNVTVALTNPSALNVTITNIAGKVIQNYTTAELNSGNSVLTIDGSKLSAGVYFYTLAASNGETVTKKMIVE